MNDSVTPEMKIQSLLPDRGGGEHKGPERGVKRSGDGLDPGLAAIVEGLVAEGDGKSSAHPAFVELDAIAAPPLTWNVYAKRGRSQF